MSKLKTLAAASMIAVLAGGSASAGTVLPFDTGTWKTGGKYAVSEWGKPAVIIVGTFAAWTIYQFFQGCSPFGRCINKG